MFCSSCSHALPVWSLIEICLEAGMCFNGEALRLLLIIVPRPIYLYGCVYTVYCMYQCCFWTHKSTRRIKIKWMNKMRKTKGMDSRKSGTSRRGSEINFNLLKMAVFVLRHEHYTWFDLKFKCVTFCRHTVRIRWNFPNTRRWFSMKSSIFCAFHSSIRSFIRGSFFVIFVG